MYTVRRPSSSSTIGSVTPVLMVTSTCICGCPSSKNFGWRDLKSRIWLAVTFSMIPLIDVPGCSNFEPLLLCDSMLASICSGVMDTAGRAGG